MAEITKFKAAEVAFHIKHDLREIPDGKSFGNEAIDKEKTHLNYSLIDRGKNAAEVNNYRKQIEKEIFMYKRKDLVHAVEVVVQCPKDCPEEQKEAFFQESYNYIVSQLPMGEKCVFVAEVHRDEKHFSPDGEMISKDHLHVMYIPAIPDTKHDGYEYRLCADALTKRGQLQKFHPGLQKHLNQAGINATVYTGKSDGKKIGLSVSQLKEITKQTGVVIDKALTLDNLIEIINENQQLKLQIKELEKVNERTNVWKQDVDIEF